MKECEIGKHSKFEMKFFIFALPNLTMAHWRCEGNIGSILTRIIVENIIIGSFVEL